MKAIKKVILAAAALSFLLVACGGGQKQVAQDDVCVYSSAADAKKCKDGQMSWFQPSSWGNEQLPLMVVAAYCDFNYQVVQNNSGVICVFTTKRMKLLDKAEEKK